MHQYVQSLSCKKMFAFILLVAAVIFLFTYSDIALNSYYYDDGYLELVNFGFNTSDKNLQKSDLITTTVVSIEKRDQKSIEIEKNETEMPTQSTDNLAIQEEIQEEVAPEKSTRNLKRTTIAPNIIRNISRISNDKNPILGIANAKQIKMQNETDYLVWSPQCKIPSLDPLSKEAMKYFRKEKYINCSKHELLSYVKIVDDKAFLYVDEKIQRAYSKEKINCCYSYVTRHGSKKKPDEGIKFSKCLPFKNPVNLIHDTVKISCKTEKKKTVYENVHEAITRRAQLIAHSKITQNTTSQSPSVLFIGIDSISRLNLIRAMPKTFNYLSNRSDTWLPLHGYNKIGENTFPNLMAIFTGYNESVAYDICNPKTIGRLDDCRFIWKDFKKFGYITAYGEDETSINTFNYRKKGFTKEPVDYYFRPYMLAAESLGVVKEHSLSYCAGPETSGERIMNLAKNFAIAYKQHKTFGFFWTNTFSHNYLNTPSTMDEKVQTLLEEITDAGILDNSIVVFLSDHGIRFGDIRHTFTGWLEERLPFIFFSFPPWFRDKYSKELDNFQINTNRLTTPYNVHLTLQHILILSGFNYTMRPVETCPSCTSLFDKIDLNRSCETAAITPHWCTCGGYSQIDKKEETVINAAYFLIGQVQKTIEKLGGTDKCAKYQLGKVLTSYISDRFSYKNDTYLLMGVETFPKAVFESTLHLKIDAKNNVNFVVDSSISRLDSYAQHAKCVNDDKLKKYCFCK